MNFLFEDIFMHAYLIAESMVKAKDGLVQTQRKKLQQINGKTK